MIAAPPDSAPVEPPEPREPVFFLQVDFTQRTDTGETLYHRTFTTGPTQEEAERRFRKWRFVAKDRTTTVTRLTCLAGNGPIMRMPTMKSERWRDKYKL